MCAYDEELEAEIESWVKAQIAESPELGERVLEALRRSSDDPAPE
ncbi:hypothetical protein [Micromonospora sp. NPDC048839]